LHQLKGLDTCIRSINHAYQRVGRFVDNRSLPIRVCCRLPGGILNAVLSNQRVVEFLNKCPIIGLKDRHSISPSYFQSLIDPDDYKCLTDPVDVARCQKNLNFTIPILRYKLEAGFSVVVGMVVGYQGSDAQTTIDVVYEVSSRIFSSKKSWLIDSKFEPQRYVN